MNLNVDYICMEILKYRRNIATTTLDNADGECVLKIATEIKKPEW